METGQRGASRRDIEDLCDIYEVSPADRLRLVELAAAGKRLAHWQPFAVPYSTYVGLEAEAGSISDFGLGLIPGLLQTPDYARAVIRANIPHRSPELVDQLVEGRIARQRLLTAENGPAFTAVLEVAVLHRIVGGRAVMLAQLQHLLEVSELGNVSVRVIPFEAGALPVPNNKFIILSYPGDVMPDVIFVEGLTGDLYLEREEDITVYNDAFRALLRIASSAQETRATIGSLIKTYQL